MLTFVFNQTGRKLIAKKSNMQPRLYVHAPTFQTYHFHRIWSNVLLIYIRLQKL